VGGNAEEGAVSAKALRQKQAPEVAAVVEQRVRDGNGLVLPTPLWTVPSAMHSLHHLPQAGSGSWERDYF
jgi:hypothetical protein